MSIDAELNSQLVLLRQQFSSGLPKRFDAIVAALDACRNDPTNETPLHALMTVLHSLRGAAGIFGFAALGDKARDAENLVMDWITAGGGNPQGMDVLAAEIASWREPVSTTSKA